MREEKTADETPHTRLKPSVNSLDQVRVVVVIGAPRARYLHKDKATPVEGKDGATHDIGASGAIWR